VTLSYILIPTNNRCKSRKQGKNKELGLEFTV